MSAGGNVPLPIIRKGRMLMYIAILASQMNLDEALRALSMLGGVDASVFRDIARLLEASARDYRVDLDPVSRSLIPKVIEEFYERTGYVIDYEDKGSLKAMIAFMAKLVEDELRYMEIGDHEKARELRVVQLRFLNTHVKPLLEGIISAGDESLVKVAKSLLELINNDIELLKEILTGRE